ncbi:uncharacterized protein LOC135467816 isoform X3 [Liolophura sinensis]|uniref:uncharacterized protein LOC135467816 isoform X3 n=1 Tax=Liolophura sinensis TaxID=3198878 RepID=UPI003159107C
MAGGKSVTVVDPKSVGSDEYKRRRQSTENQMYYLYIFVAFIVSSSWLLGTFEFSFLWVFLLSAILFTVWKTQVTQLVRRHLQLEEVMVHRKRALRNSETTEWLNFIINRWWVFSSSTIEDLIKKRLDSRLATVKPTFINQIELFSFMIGEETPHLKNVTVFEFDDGYPGGQKPINWRTVMQPPFGLHKLSSFKVVVEADLALHSNDFKMTFRSLLGVNRASILVDSAVENLNITGRVQIIIHLSMDVPFPHISKATVFFTETPEVWFNVRSMKALQLMQIPLLKTWIYTHVMEGFTAALVDPGRVDLSLAKAGPVYSPLQKLTPKPLAQGVLTIRLKGKHAPKQSDSSDILYHVVKCRERKRTTHEVYANEEWEAYCSFFIYDLAKDRISVKRKCKRLLTSVTLEEIDLPLSKYPLQVKKKVSTDIEGKDGSVITLFMDYDSLPPINLNEPAPKSDADAAKHLPVEEPTSEVSGVMYVAIHSASNVLISDKGGASDPYCVLFCDRSRVLTTPYVAQTRNPKWESNVEFFVRNFSKMSLSFYVYDWDGTSVIDDDFLGSAHLSLTRNQPKVIKKVLTLGYNQPAEGHVENKSFGCITVSAVFRPVSAVAQSEKYREYYEGWTSDNLYKEGEVRQNVPLHQSTPLQPLGRPPNHPSEGSDMTHGQGTKKQSPMQMAAAVLEDKLLVELHILQAKELMGADRNGMSDPYVEVKKGKKKLYETSVKKKTLTPQWNENVTFMLPDEKEHLEITVQDKDFIGKDFLGHLSLSVDQLKALSMRGSPQWFHLENAKSGQIELGCSITSSDEKTLENRNSNNNNIIVDFSHPVKTSSTHDQSPLSKLATGSAQIQNAIKSANSHHGNRGDDSFGYSGNEGYSSLETDISGYDSSHVSVVDSSMEVPASPTVPVPVINLPSEPIRHTENGTQHKTYMPNGGHGAGTGEDQPDDGRLQVPDSPPQRRLTPGRSGMRMKRSVSDVNVSQSKDKKSPAFSTHRLRPSESLHSFGGWDSVSTASSVLPSDKFYKVRGTLHWASGLSHLKGDVYCKIRVDNRRAHHRTKRLAPGKVVAKTPVLKASGDRAVFEFPFEVDHGKGVAAEGLIIFDLKEASNRHLATMGFSLKYLLGETDYDKDLQRHLSLEKGMEVELTLSHSEMDPALLKKKSGMFKSLSFRKDK